MFEVERNGSVWASFLFSLVPVVSRKCFLTIVTLKRFANTATSLLYNTIIQLRILDAKKEYCVRSENPTASRTTLVSSTFMDYGFTLYELCLIILWIRKRRVCEWVMDTHRSGGSKLARDKSVVAVVCGELNWWKTRSCRVVNWIGWNIVVSYMQK